MVLGVRLQLGARSLYWGKDLGTSVMGSGFGNFCIGARILGPLHWGKDLGSCCHEEDDSQREGAGSGTTTPS